MDKRADDLHQEYVSKARSTDRMYMGMGAGEVGPVENKLLSFGEVKGLVFGNFGECSEAAHALMSAMATSRVRVSGPQVGRNGVIRTEEGEKAVVMGYIRRRISVASVKGQCFSLLGRLDPNRRYRRLCRPLS